ncbi:uncharacterized protein fgl2b isoform X2 [Brachyhypopomus gauderio]|uniref:uncharacterized protein fgl2b isoform X2 n=1 Tax=Brachyhypopomus gauderio TaxID=698409 RepID=UPI004041AF1D
MWLAVLFAWGNLFMFVASQSCGEASKDAASWVRLKPQGHCRDGDTMCPYSVTLPPLTIQLPRHLKELDTMARELQALTLMVNQLKEECRECRGRQRPEWSVRTDDGGDAGERIQASRGTVNTRERQPDLHKRARISLNSAEEDSMLISSGTRAVNRVTGTPGWDISQERKTRPNGSGQRAESSEGPRASISSQTETAAENVSDVRVLHTFTGEERAKESEFTTAQTTESPLAENQDEEPPTHYGKASAVKIGHAKDTSGTLTAPGNTESIPEISVVTMVSENVDDETKQVQVNLPNKDGEIKRLHGFPRPMDINRKEGKMNTNTENRLNNPGGMRKVFSSSGDKPVQSTGRIPVRTGNGRLNGKTPQMADRRGATGSGRSGLNKDINRPDVILKTPFRMVSKNFSGERNPTSSVKGQNNREQQDANKEKVSDSGVKPFSLDEAGNANVGGPASTAHYPTSENKGSRKQNNHRGGSLSTDVEKDIGDLNPVIPIKTVSGLEKPQLFVPDKAIVADASNTNLPTQDRKSESPFSLSMDPENDTRIDFNRFNRNTKLDQSVMPISYSADPIANRHQRKPQSMDSNSEHTLNPSADATSNTEMLSNPINMSDATVHESGTNPQGLANNDLLKGQLQIKPEVSKTRPNTGKITSSSLINAHVDRTYVLRINNTVPVNTDPVKQTLFTNRSEKSTVRDKQGAPAAGHKRMGRPRPSGLVPLSQANIHSLNRTMNFSRLRQPNLPNLRTVKNVTMVNPNHVERPETTRLTRVILAKNPKLGKPHFLQNRPENENEDIRLKVFMSGGAKNTSGDTENTMGIMNRGDRYVNNQTEPTTDSPKLQIKSTEFDFTQSIKPTVATHAIVDQNKSQTVPTVEASNSLNFFQIENTSQIIETKLFHVTKPPNPGGKRELDPIAHGVRDHNVETVINHNTVSRDSYENSGRGSHQAAVEKTEETDRRKRPKPSVASIVSSIQENDEEPSRVGTPPNYSRNILQTVKREGSKRKQINHPTVDTPHTRTSLLKDKQGPVTQLTTPTASTSHFMDQDYVEKVETVTAVKVSDTHFHHRLKNSSQDVESKTLTEKISGHDTEDKQSDTESQTTDKDGVSSNEKLLHPNSMDSVQNRGNGSNPVMDRIKTSTVPKGSALFTESTPIIYHKTRKPSFTTSKSTDKNNGYNSGNTYTVSVGRTGNVERERESVPQRTSKEINKGPDTVINLVDRGSINSQLRNTCQGQCDQRPTPQTPLDTQRSPDSGRDEPPHDCSDLKKNMTTGVYSMTRVGSKHTSFHVFCDMEASGGGWTVIQRRLDGTISFNRTWDDYKKGFGHLTGEFWLGNDKIHWLTTTRAMVLRIELEDLDGVKEFAQYDDFYVANESLKYQLTIGGYSGTAGNAMQESKSFNHNQKFFSTPDRDNDEYSSGSCAAYYASGWWFDACMAANLNGKYYQTRYKGVRNGIFWGTWHNMSNEYYPTNERQSFRTVRMMMRPRTSSVTDF